MISIMGVSGCGKTTLANALKEYGYNPLIIYTTRPPRPGEMEGEDYYFRDKETFDSLNLDEVRRYDTVFGEWAYGSYFKDYKDDVVAILSPSFFETISDQLTGNVFFIDVDKETLFKKAKERGDDEREYERRYLSDMDFLDKVKDDERITLIDNKGFKACPLELADKIVSLIK